MMKTEHPTRAGGVRSTGTVSV